MRKQALLGLACAIGLIGAGTVQQFSKQLSGDLKIEQALNRLTFGARPGDAEQVRKTGLKKWVDRQLHPERILENPVLEEKLKTLDSLRMSSSELVRNYPAPQVIRQMVNGQVPLPSDPERRRMIQRLVARAESKQGGVAGAKVAEPVALRDLLSPEEVRSLRTATSEQRVA